MSAVLYTSYRDLVHYHPELDKDGSLVDATCKLELVCLQAPVAISVGDANEPNRFRPVVLIENIHDKGIAHPLMVCEDCAEWLTEALNSRIEDADDCR